MAEVVELRSQVLMRAGISFLSATLPVPTAKHLGRCFLLAMLSLSAASSNFPAQAQSAEVSAASFGISSSGPELRVQTYRDTPLPEVFSSVCRQAAIQCSDLELLSSYSLPAMSVEGKFRQVIERLLEGTSINFEYVHATADSPIESLRLSRGPGEMMAHRDPTPSSSSVDAATGPGLMSSEALAEADSADTSQDDPNQATLSSDAAGPNQPAQIQKAVESMFAGGYATEVIPSAFLPFPDSQGQPIPAKPVEGPSYLPFPDQFGNPIPTKVSKPGSPFPMPTADQPH